MIAKNSVIEFASREVSVQDRFWFFFLQYSIIPMEFFPLSPTLGLVILPRVSGELAVVTTN